MAHLHVLDHRDGLHVLPLRLPGLGYVHTRPVGGDRIRHRASERLTPPPPSLQSSSASSRGRVGGGRSDGLLWGAGVLGGNRRQAGRTRRLPGGVAADGCGEAGPSKSTQTCAITNQVTNNSPGLHASFQCNAPRTGPAGQQKRVAGRKTGAPGRPTSGSGPTCGGSGTVPQRTQPP